MNGFVALWIHYNCLELEDHQLNFGDVVVRGYRQVDAVGCFSTVFWKVSFRNVRFVRLE